MGCVIRTHDDCLREADRVIWEERAASDKRSKVNGQPSPRADGGDGVGADDNWYWVADALQMLKGRSDRKSVVRKHDLMACQSWNPQTTLLVHEFFSQVKCITASVRINSGDFASRL